MPLPGGDADKVGNRYELRWTVLRLLDVLEGRADSLCIEPLGDAGRGVEFVLRMQQGDVCYQVKRQRSEGPWSLSALAREDVLRSFQMHLQSGARCVFASMTQAGELLELSDRARQSASWEQFQAHHLRAESWRKQFENLCKFWGDIPGTKAHEMLQRVEVRTQDETTLQEYVLVRIESLVTGEPENVYDVLAGYAWKSIHHELRAEELWAHLRERGFSPRDWHRDTKLRRQLTERAEFFATNLEGLGIGGQMVAREQTDQIVQFLDNRKRVLLTGKAGSGKSSVLAQVIRKALRTGWPVLALRADQEVQASTPEKFGEAIGLPGAPAAILSGVAAGGDALLVIDQLDAVSHASGRNPERFDVLLAIFRQTDAFPHVHVLLACRQFDVDNDDRFRVLVAGNGATVVPIGGLDTSTTEHILKDEGVDIRALDAKLQELLVLPLHLRLYIELVRADTPGMPTVRSLKELYDRYWDSKQQTVRQRLGRAGGWKEVVEQLCDDMNRRQELSIPQARLDRYAEECRALISEGVLVLDGRQIRFFHETFFDYAFARTFIARDNTLSSLLEAGRQELFQRAQVRQLLLHQREEDRTNYLENLRMLVNGDGIRFHLQLIVLSLVGSLTDPTFEEWDIVAPLLEGSPDGACAGPLWSALRQHETWFRLADKSGCWRRWLSSEHEHLVDAAMWALSGAHAHSSERVVALMRACARPTPSGVSAKFLDIVAEGPCPDTAWGTPLGPHDYVQGFAGHSTRWREHMRNHMLYKNLASTPTLFEFLLDQVDEGSFDEQYLNSILGLGSILKELTKNQPAWGAKLISRWMQRQFQTTNKTPGEKPPGLRELQKGGWPAEELLQPIALKAPEEFVEEVLPCFLTMLSLEQASSLPEGTSNIEHLTPTHALSEALVEALTEALRSWANQAPDRCRPWIHKLRNSPWKLAHHLAATAYSGNERFFAEEAIDWLCTAPAAFEIGHKGTRISTSCQLIAAVTPHCSETALERLCSTILHHYPTWERQTKARRFSGSAQIELLTAIDEKRRSQAVRRRLGELERKLGRPAKHTHQIQASWIGSPIPEERARRLSDEQWLQAMLGISHNNWRQSKQGKLFGGARDLSLELERRTINEPKRFAQLFLRLPPDVNGSYIDGILCGLRQAKLDPKLLLRISQHVQSIGSSEAGRFLVDLIGHHAELDLSDELLDIVTAYATNLAADDWKKWHSDDIDTHAINCTRGRAVIALGLLIEAEPSRLLRLKPALERLAKDAILAVRVAVIEVCIRMLHIDPNLAIRLFLELLERDEAVLASRNIEEFVYRAQWRHYEAISSVVQQMLASSIPEAAKAGARQITLASMGREFLDTYVDSCLNGSVEQRMGVAEVASTNIEQGPRYERLQELLARLLNDESKAVREIALRCFRRLEGTPLERYKFLFEALASSRALDDDLAFSMTSLASAPPRLPLEVLKACEKWVDRQATQNRGDARVLTQLVLRIYAQRREPEVRSRCLDVVDRLLMLKQFGVDDVLEEFSR